MPELNPEKNKTAGAIIKESRLAANLSLKILAEITKIQPRVLKLIENDEWSKTIAEATYRGFIKILARELKFKLEDVFKKPAGTAGAVGAVGGVNPATDAEKKRIFLLPIILPKFNYGLYFLAVILIILFFHWLSRIFVFLFWR